MPKTKKKSVQQINKNNRIIMQKIRRKVEYRKKEKKMDREAKLQLRTKVECNEKEKILSKHIMRKKRENEDYKQKERIKKKDALSKKRQNVEFKIKEKEKIKEIMARKRGNEEFKMKERKKNMENISKRRQNEEFKVKERKKIIEIMARKRQNEEFKVKERKKNMGIMARKRQNEEFKVKERQKNRESISKRRQKEEFKEEQRKNIKGIMKNKRLDENFKIRERKIMSKLMKMKRQVLEYKKKERENRKKYMARERASKIYRKIEKERKRKLCKSNDERYSYKEMQVGADRKKRMRSNEILRYRELFRRNLTRNNSNANAEKIAFLKSIEHGPETVCCCCEGLFFLNSVVEFDTENIDSKLKISKKLKEVGFKNMIINFKSTKICRTCFKYVSREEIPKLATSRGLKFPDIPECISILSPLEERMVAPYINFMQIRPLKPFSLNPQLSLKGSIVNIAVEIQDMIKVLPRKFDQMATIQIKLKRHMEHASDYMMETIRPAVVCDALKFLLNTPLYKKYSISVDNEFFTKYDEQYSEKLDFVTDEKEVKNEKATTENQNIIDENEFDIDEVILLEPKKQSNDESIAVLAPGQGKRPVPWHLVSDLDELSFPKIFCGTAFSSDVSYTDRIKSEIRRQDRRSCIPTRLLYMAKRKLEKMCSSCINISLKKLKTTEKKLTAKMVASKDFLENYIKIDEGCQVLKQIRFSPAYWESKKKILLAMICQLGPPTFFLTLSAAEKEWLQLLKILSKVVSNRNISLEEAVSMDENSRTKLIRNDPVTCARYFNYKMCQMMKYIKSNHGPFEEYNVIDSYERVEFQMRGSPHEHMFLWLNKAPEYSPDDSTSINECTAFIDRFITCEYDESNPYINLQYHRHSYSCHKGKRNKKKCRFNFPMPVMPKTMILKPFSEDEEVTEEVKGHLKKIRKLMLDFYKNKCFVDFKDILNKLELNEDEYVHAIRSSLSRTQIFLKRNSLSVGINCYNKNILTLFESNMDIQFVLDPYSCASYIINYISKTDAGLSKLLREAASDIENGNITIKQKLRKIANVFINGNLMSAQEAVYHCLSLPLSKSSRSSIFINTNPSENRTKMLKPLAILQKMDPDSSEIFFSDVITKYSKRCDKLENTCLADFATKYNMKNRKELNSNEDTDDVIDEIKARQKMKILRFRKYNLAQDPDNYFRVQILLFLPWRDEVKDVEKQNYENKYFKNIETIETNRKKYCIVKETELEEAMKLARNNRKEITEAEEADFDADKLSQQQHVDIFYQESIHENEEKSRTTLPPEISEDEVLIIMRSLNAGQKRIVMHVLNSFKIGKLPLRIFISGAAGAGKSKVIMALYKLLIRYFNKKPGVNSSSLKVLLCAPSGKAAFLINGVTLHTAFALPVSKFGGPMPDLSSEVAANIRINLIDLKLLIIDEISMVGSRLFDRIDKRLKQITGKDETFGGVSVIVVGDLNQLPPVMDSPIFLPPKTSNLQVFAESNLLWEEFRMYQLTEIMRQKEEKEFITALNGIAVGEISNEIKELLKTRMVEEATVPPRVIRLYTDNKSVDAHNEKVIVGFPGDIIFSVAKDEVLGKMKENTKSNIIESLKRKKTCELNGLPSKISLKKGIRYMITKNVDVEDGLVNGAVGILEYISVEELTKQPTKLWLNFGSAAIGKKAKICHSNILINSEFKEGLVPISKASAVLHISSNQNLQIVRKQFPVVPAEAITIHKSQGQTYEEVCLDFRKSKKITRKMLYVALSRVSKLSGLYILGNIKFPNRTKLNEPTNTEMQRLRNNELKLTMEDVDKYKGTKVIYQNVRSLKKYIEDILSDHFYFTGDILIFSETHTKSDDCINIPGYKQILRSEIKNNIKLSGLMCFVKKELSIQILRHEVHIDEKRKAHMDIFCFTINGFSIVSGYKSPTVPFTTMKTIFERIMKSVSYIKDTEIIVIGDFNCTVNEKILTEFMKEYRLVNILDENSPTTDMNSQIDIILASTHKCKSGVYESYFSDHKPIWVNMNQETKTSNNDNNFSELGDARQINTLNDITVFISNYGSFSETFLKLNNDKIILKKHDFFSICTNLSFSLVEETKKYVSNFVPGWLTDAVIESFFFRLTQKYSHLAMGDLILFSFLQHGLDVKTLLPNLTCKTHFILPMNISGNHWTLLAVRLDTGDYYYLDPKGGRINCYELDIINRMLSFLMNKNWTHKYVKYFQQSDSINCGTFICWYAERFIKNEDFTQSFNPDSYRIVIFNSIIENSM